MINIKTVNYGKKIKEFDSNKSIEIDPDLKVIDFNGADFLLFSPANQKIIQINKGGFKELKSITETKQLSDDLINSGLFVNKESKPINYPNNEQYITIIFTGCNLDCRFCYLDEKFKRFKEGFLEASIKKFSSPDRENWISFHGGETNYSRKKIKEIVRFSKKELDSVKFAIQTNGVMKDNFARWINQNIDNITLSTPGIKKFQNKYRPLKGGAKTHKKVKDFLKIVDVDRLTTHTVITQENINFLEDIVDYLYKKGIRKMEFGPLLDTEKSIENNLERPDIDLYIKNVLKVIDKYSKKEAKFSFWGVYKGVRGKTCMVYNKNSVSLFNGNVIGKCLDINNIFDIGCYKGNNFDIDKKRLTGINKDDLNQFPSCRDCFLKHNCSGLCPLRNYEYSGSIEKPNPKRCQEVKKINKKFITYTALKEIGYRPSEKYSELNKNIKSLKVNLGSECNNHCLFCKQINNKIKKKEKEQIKKIINKNKNKYDQIIFTGGEVTLRNDLFDLIKHAKDKGFNLIEIETNGRRLFYKDYCQELINSGVNNFKVSLHGPDQKTHDNLTKVEGSFHQTVKGIKNLVSMNQNVSINYVIIDKNYKKIPRMVDFLSSLGISEIKFNFLQVNDKSLEKELINKKNDVDSYLSEGIKKAKKLKIKVSINNIS